MMNAVRIDTDRVAPGPWHLFDGRDFFASPTTLRTTCGLDMTRSDVAFAQFGYDRSRDVSCGDCTKAEVLRLSAMAESARQFGWSSRDGYCRHGVYVGGSGIDWMCGTCESFDLAEEIAMLRQAAADTLRKAVYR